jgi:hypothetical protein
MDNIIAEYVLLTFGGSFGAIQIAAAYAGLRGLWLFGNKALTYLGGLAVLGAAFGWFFARVDLKMGYGDLAGSQQLSWFIAGTIGALVATFIISSLTNFRLRPPKNEPDSETGIGKGLEDLRTRTFYQVIVQRFKGARY